MILRVMERRNPQLPPMDLTRFRARVRPYADRIVISIEPAGKDANLLAFYILFRLRDLLGRDVTGAQVPREIECVVFGGLGTIDVPRAAEAAEREFTTLGIPLIPRPPRPQA